MTEHHTKTPIKSNFDENWRKKYNRKRHVNPDEIECDSVENDMIELAQILERNFDTSTTNYKEDLPIGRKLNKKKERQYVPFVTPAKRILLEHEEVLCFNKKDGIRDKNILKSLGVDMNNIECKTSILQSEKFKHINKKRKNVDQKKNDNNEKSFKDNESTRNSYVSFKNKKQASRGSLLEQATLLKMSTSSSDRIIQARKEEESRILREANKIQSKALQSASEVAKGVQYKDPLPTSWCPSKYVMQQGEKKWNDIRKSCHILVQGMDIPPPISNFKDMKFPAPVMEFLKERKITLPTPIQIQGLPVALSGRDMVGIAFTGSGKTIAFSLPLVMFALEEELRMPIVPDEGPLCIILAPSRELVRQTYDLVRLLCDKLHNSDCGFPEIRVQLIIGGENSRKQLEIISKKGIHCVVATPGRLRDFLKRGCFKLDICRFICLDEADRMLDLGFDEEVGDIMNHFKHQRQTLLFSATFPKKFQDFAKDTLVKPIVVNVGRAGAANLDVIQEVEYVKQNMKIVYILQCLQKTTPPVIIFCERKSDVDDIHEYLLLKGVEAVSIHGGKDQVERNEAIQLYKSGQKDVLVATDIAAKGLDFTDIKHVINFDMPAEIEGYVHRIGRTGRRGNTGVATTFINKSCEEATLLDLKHLLIEANQRIPPVLTMIDDPHEKEGIESVGCAFCGGLGHSIVDCPKIDKDAKRVSRKDALASGGGYGGDW